MNGTDHPTLFHAIHRGRRAVLDELPFVPGAPRSVTRLRYPA